MTFTADLDISFDRQHKLRVRNKTVVEPPYINERLLYALT